MTRRPWLLHLAAVLGYALVAVVFSWPLLPNAATHLTGDPGGDTGVYVWNQWVFQHGAVVEGRNPLTTEHIFSLSSQPVDLSQHNYTMFLDVLAMPLLGWLGTVVTFNLVYLAVVVLTAWMTFVLARRVTGGAVFESWLAGAVFVWAPLMVARSTGHFSLVAAAPLPAFLWCLHRVERSERLRDSALAGGVVAWAAFCDAYYAVYCLMIAAVYIGSRLLRLEWRPDWHRGVGRWILDLVHPARRRAGGRTGARSRRPPRLLRRAGQRPRPLHADAAAHAARPRAACCWRSAPTCRASRCRPCAPSAPPSPPA